MASALRTRGFLRLGQKAHFLPATGRRRPIRYGLDCAHPSRLDWYSVVISACRASRAAAPRASPPDVPGALSVHQELAPDALSFSGLEIHPRPGEQVLCSGDFVREGLIGAVDVGAELPPCVAPSETGQHTDQGESQQSVVRLLQRGFVKAELGLNLKQPEVVACGRTGVAFTIRR